MWALVTHAKRCNHDNYSYVQFLLLRLLNKKYVVLQFFVFCIKISKEVLLL